MAHPDRPPHWDLDRVDRAPWPWEPPTEPVRVHPDWTAYNSGPMVPPPYLPHPLDQVTKTRRETRHGLHLLLTFCTFGLWAFTGWPIAWAWNRFGPRRVTVTKYR